MTSDVCRIEKAVSHDRHLPAWPLTPVTHTISLQPILIITTAKIHKALTICPKHFCNLTFRQNEKKLCKSLHEVSFQKNKRGRNGK